MATSLGALFYEAGVKVGNLGGLEELEKKLSGLKDHYNITLEVSGVSVLNDLTAGSVEAERALGRISSEAKDLGTALKRVFGSGNIKEGNIFSNALVDAETGVNKLKVLAAKQQDVIDKIRTTYKSAPDNKISAAFESKSVVRGLNAYIQEYRTLASVLTTIREEAVKLGKDNGGISKTQLKSMDEYAQKALSAADYFERIVKNINLGGKSSANIVQNLDEVLKMGPGEKWKKAFDKSQIAGWDDELKKIFQDMNLLGKQVENVFFQVGQNTTEAMRNAFLSFKKEMNRNNELFDIRDVEVYFSKFHVAKGAINNLREEVQNYIDSNGGITVGLKLSRSAKSNIESSPKGTLQVDFEKQGKSLLNVTRAEAINMINTMLSEMKNNPAVKDWVDANSKYIRKRKFDVNEDAIKSEYTQKEGTAKVKALYRELEEIYNFQKTVQDAATVAGNAIDAETEKIRQQTNALNESNAAMAEFMMLMDRRMNAFSGAGPALTEAEEKRFKELSILAQGGTLSETPVKVEAPKEPVHVETPVVIDPVVTTTNAKPITEAINKETAQISDSMKAALDTVSGFEQKLTNLFSRYSASWYSEKTGWASNAQAQEFKDQLINLRMIQRGLNGSDSEKFIAEEMQKYVDSLNQYLSKGIARAMSNTAPASLIDLPNVAKDITAMLEQKEMQVIGGNTGNNAEAKIVEIGTAADVAAEKLQQLNAVLNETITNPTKRSGLEYAIKNINNLNAEEITKSVSGGSDLLSVLLDKGYSLTGLKNTLSDVNDRVLTTAENIRAMQASPQNAEYAGPLKGLAEQTTQISFKIADIQDNIGKIGDVSGIKALAPELRNLADWIDQVNAKATKMGDLLRGDGSASNPYRRATGGIIGGDNEFDALRSQLARFRVVQGEYWRGFTDSSHISPDASLDAIKQHKMYSMSAMVNKALGSEEYISALQGYLQRVFRMIDDLKINIEAEIGARARELRSVEDFGPRGVRKSRVEASKEFIAQEKYLEDLRSYFGRVGSKVDMISTGDNIFGFGKGIASSGDVALLGKVIDAMDNNKFLFGSYINATKELDVVARERALSLPGKIEEEASARQANARSAEEEAAAIQKVNELKKATGNNALIDLSAELEKRLSAMTYSRFADKNTYNYSRIGSESARVDEELRASFSRAKGKMDEMSAYNNKILSEGGFADTLRDSIKSALERATVVDSKYYNERNSGINRKYDWLDASDMKNSFVNANFDVDSKLSNLGTIEGLKFLHELSESFVKLAQMEADLKRGSGTANDPFRRDEGGIAKKNITDEANAREKNAEAADKEAKAVEKANQVKGQFTKTPPEGTLWSQWYSKGIDLNNPTSVGGKIVGPGTGTSDSIHLMASNGEFIVNARATEQFRKVLDEINNFGLGRSNVDRIENAFASLGVNAKASVIEGMQLNGVSLSESSLMTIKAQIESVLGGVNIAGTGLSSFAERTLYRNGGGGLDGIKQEMLDGYNKATENCEKYAEKLRTLQAEYDKLDKRTVRAKEIASHIRDAKFYYNQAVDTQAMWAKNYDEAGFGKLATFKEALAKEAKNGAESKKAKEVEAAKDIINGYIRTLEKTIESVSNDIRKSSAKGDNVEAQTKLVQRMETFKKALQDVLSGEKKADVAKLAGNAWKNIDDMLNVGRKSARTTDAIADIERNRRMEMYKVGLAISKREQQEEDKRQKNDNKRFDERVKSRVKSMIEADKTLASVRKDFDAVNFSVQNVKDARFGDRHVPVNTSNILTELTDIERKLQEIENMPVGSKRVEAINAAAKELSNRIATAKTDLKDETSIAYNKARRNYAADRREEKWDDWRERRNITESERRSRELRGQKSRLESFEKSLDQMVAERGIRYPGGKTATGFAIDFTEADKEIARLKVEIDNLKKSVSADEIRKAFRRGGSLDTGVYKIYEQKAVKSAAAEESRRNSDFDSAVKRRVAEIEAAEKELVRFRQQYEDLMHKIQNPTNKDYRGIPVKIDATEATATLDTVKQKLDAIASAKSTKKAEMLDQVRKDIESGLSNAKDQYKNAGKAAYDAAKKDYGKAQDDKALEAKKKNLELYKESLKEVIRHRDALYEGGKLAGTNQVVDFSKADAEMKRLNDEIDNLIKNATSADQIINALKKGGTLSLGKYTNLQNEAVHDARVALTGSKKTKGKTDAEIEAENQRKLKNEIANTTLALERMKAAMMNDATRGNITKSAITSLERVLAELKAYQATPGSASAANTEAVLDWVVKAKVARTEAATQLAEQRAHNAEINNGADAWNRAALSQNLYQSQTMQTLKSVVDLDQQFSMLAMTIQNTFSIMWLQQFAKEVIHIGGELEKQQLAMNSILGSEMKSQEIYSKVANLSMISPFTVQDLVKNTKQLSAFGVEYDDLYDTVRRLSDISAAVGVDFGRIAYEYGQMESMGYLDRRHLRMFSMSGVPLSQELKKYYSQERGEDVSQHEIDKMIAKRQIDAEVVKNILKSMTNEGGKFYNMQQIMAESLAAKYANLDNAWNLMLGDMAQSNFGDSLKDLATLLTALTKQWKLIGSIGAFSVLSMALVKLNPLVRMATAGMGDMSTAVFKNITNESKLQAQILRTRSAYEQLNSVERARMLNSGKVTFDALMKEQKITKELAAQLYLRKQIDATQFMALKGKLGFTDEKAADDYYRSFGLGKGQTFWGYVGDSIKSKWGRVTDWIKDSRGIGHDQKLGFGNIFSSKNANLKAQIEAAKKMYRDELQRINAKNGVGLTNNERNILAWNKRQGDAVAPQIFAKYAKETNMSSVALKNLYKTGELTRPQFVAMGKAIGMTSAELRGMVVQVIRANNSMNAFGVGAIRVLKLMRLSLTSVWGYLKGVGSALVSMVTNPYMALFAAFSAVTAYINKIDEAKKRVEELTSATKERGHEGLEKINELLDGISEKAKEAKKNLDDVNAPGKDGKKDEKNDKDAKDKNSVVSDVLEDGTKSVNQASASPLAAILAVVEAVKSAAEEASDSVSKIGASAENTAKKAKRALTDDEFIALMPLNNNVPKDSVKSVMQAAIEEKTRDFRNNWSEFDVWKAAGAQDMMKKLGFSFDRDLEIDELKASVFPKALHRLDGLMSDSADFSELRKVYENFFGQFKTSVASTVVDSAHAATDTTGEEIARIVEAASDAEREVAKEASRVVDEETKDNLAPSDSIKVPVEVEIDKPSVEAVSDTIQNIGKTEVEVEVKPSVAASNPFEGSSKGMSNKDIRDNVEKMKDILREYYPEYGNLFDEGGILEINKKTKENVHDASEQFDVLLEKVMQVKSAMELLEDSTNGIAGAFGLALNATDDDWIDDMLDKNLDDLNDAAIAYTSIGSKIFGSFSREAASAFKEYAGSEAAMSLLDENTIKSLKNIKSANEALNILKNIESYEDVLTGVGEILEESGGVSDRQKDVFVKGLKKAVSDYNDVRETAEEDAETFYESYKNTLAMRGIDVDDLSVAQKIAIRADIESNLKPGEGRDWFIAWLENKGLIPEKVEIEEIKVKNRTDLQKALIGQINKEEIAIDIFGNSAKADSHEVDGIFRTIEEIVDKSADVVEIQEDLEKQFKKVKESIGNLQPDMDALDEQAIKDKTSIEEIAKASKKLEVVESFRKLTAEAKQLEHQLEFLKGGKSVFQNKILGKISKSELSASIFGKEGFEDSEVIKSIVKDIEDVVTKSKDVVEIQSSIEKKLKDAKEGILTLTPEISRMQAEAKKGGKSVEEIAEAEGKIDQLNTFKRLNAEIAQLDKILMFAKGEMNDFQKMLLDTSNFETISVRFGMDTDSASFAKAKMELVDLVSKTDDVFETQENVSKELKSVEEKIAKLAPKMMNLQDAANNAGESLADYAASNGFTTLLNQMNALMAKYYELKNMVDSSDGDLSDYQKKLLNVLSDNYVSSDYKVKEGDNTKNVGRQSGHFGTKAANAKEQAYLDQIDSALRSNLTIVDTANAINSIYKEIESNIEILEKTEAGKNSEEYQWYKNIEGVLQRVANAGGFKLEKKGEKESKSKKDTVLEGLQQRFKWLKEIDRIYKNGLKNSEGSDKAWEKAAGSDAAKFFGLPSTASFEDYLEAAKAFKEEAYKFAHGEKEDKYNSIGIESEEFYFDLKGTYNKEKAEKAFNGYKEALGKDISKWKNIKAVQELGFGIEDAIIKQFGSLDAVKGAKNLQEWLNSMLSSLGVSDWHGLVGKEQNDVMDILFGKNHEEPDANTLERVMKIMALVDAANSEENNIQSERDSSYTEGLDKLSEYEQKKLAIYLKYQKMIDEVTSEEQKNDLKTIRDSEITSLNIRKKGFLANTDTWSKSAKRSQYLANRALLANIRANGKAYYVNGELAGYKAGKENYSLSVIKELEDQISSMSHTTDKATDSFKDLWLWITGGTKYGQKVKFGDVAQGLKDSISEIGSIVQSTAYILGGGKGTASDNIGTWFGIAGSAISSVDKFYSGDYVGGTEDANAAISATIDELNRIEDKRRQSEEDLKQKRFTVLMSGIEDLKNSLLEAMGVNNVNETYALILKAQEAADDKLRKDIDEKVNYSPTNKHSTKYALREKLTDADYDAINNALKIAGVWQEDVRSIEQILQFSGEQWKALREYANSQYSDITTTATMKSGGNAIYDEVESLIEQAEKKDEIEKTLVKIMTGTSIDDMKRTFHDAMMDMSADAEDFADTFSEAMMSAVVDNYILGEEFQTWLKEWLDDWKNIMADETLSDDERARRLNAKKQEVVERREQSMADRDYWADALGYTGDGGKSGTANSIKGITEETADILAAYVNEIRIDGYMSRVAIEQLSYTEMPTLNATAESSLRQLEMQTEYLRMIQESSSMIYERVERMDSDLHSVIYGSNSVAMR